MFFLRCYYGAQMSLLWKNELNFCVPPHSLIEIKKMNVTQNVAFGCSTRSLKSLHFEFGVILPCNGVNNYVVMSKLPLLAHTSTLGIRAGLEKTRIRSRMATPNMTQGHNNV